MSQLDSYSAVTVTELRHEAPRLDVLPYLRTNGAVFDRGDAPAPE